MLIVESMYVFLLVLVQEQINIHLMQEKEFVLAFAQKIFLWKIRPNNVKLYVQQGMLNQQQGIVLLNVLEILKHMLTFPLKHVFINV